MMKVEENSPQREEVNDQEIRKNDIKRQMVLYFIFAFLMYLLNLTLQLINEAFIYPFICTNFGHIDFIHLMYCSTDPIKMYELVGMVVAVGITYIIKFFLDKYIVFKKSGSELKDTSKEFGKYFIFAILTTLLNLGIQFILTNVFHAPLVVSVSVALGVGYLAKFFLDRKYVFNKDYS